MVLGAEVEHFDIELFVMLDAGTVEQEASVLEIGSLGRIVHSQKDWLLGHIWDITHVCHGQVTQSGGISGVFTEFGLLQMENRVACSNLERLCVLAFRLTMPVTPTSLFQQQYPSLETRKNMSLSIQKKHPNHIPLIIQVKMSARREDSTVFKLIVQNELNAGEVLSLVRSKLNRASDQEALLMKFGSPHDKDRGTVIAIGSMSIAVLYEKYRDEDAFLYGWVEKENVFG